MRAQTTVESVLAKCTVENSHSTGEHLADLGPAAVDELVGRFVAEHRAETPDAARTGAIAVALQSRKRQALTSLKAAVGAEPDVALRRAGIALCGEIGGTGDLSQAFALAVVAGDSPDRDACSRALRACVARMVVRQAIDSSDVLKVLQDAEFDLCIAVVRGIGDARSARTFALLSSLLHRDVVNDTTLLSELGRAARAGASTNDARVLDDIRACLRAFDATTVREAALCVGSLVDDEAADELAAMLDGSDAIAAANAHWSLKRITGRDLGPRAAAWDAWFAAERDWWKAGADQALVQLASPVATQRATALHVLADHRFPRRTLSAAIADALSPIYVDTVDGACRLLEELGSDGAISGLQCKVEVAPDLARERIELALAVLSH